MDFERRKFMDCKTACKMFFTGFFEGLLPGCIAGGVVGFVGGVVITQLRESLNGTNKTETTDSE